MMNENIKEKLTTLFYLLMRDELPVGYLIKHIETAKEVRGKCIYTNENLSELAMELVDRIINV